MLKGGLQTRVGPGNGTGNAVKSEKDGMNVNGTVNGKRTGREKENAIENGNEIAIETEIDIEKGRRIKTETGIRMTEIEEKEGVVRKEGEV